MPQFYKSRLPVLASRWFDRAKAALLGELPCRKGCYQCCFGPFAVTVRDIAELQLGLAEMDPARRDTMQELARRHIAAIEARYPRLAESPWLDDWPDAEIDRLAAEFAELPCPALQPDGSCGVYPFRPVTCRMMGIPVEEGETVHGACAVQTFVPVLRLSRSLRQEEEHLARQEADELDRLRRDRRISGEEVLLPYGFLPDRAPETLRGHLDRA
ncbi:MAG: YkgJ family cysteine cluster protein [Nitrospirota bacterium]